MSVTSGYVSVSGAAASDRPNDNRPLTILAQSKKGGRGLSMPRNGRRRIIGKHETYEQDARAEALRDLLKELRWDWKHRPDTEPASIDESDPIEGGA
jgi:hypothetical protein